MVTINGANFLDVHNITQKKFGEVAINNWHKKDKQTKRDFFRVVLRSLLNYLATATTLIDHTRKLIRNSYADTAIEKSYNEQIEVLFKTSDLNIFVNDLRNFFTHYAIPIISRNFYINDENSTEAITLNKGKLLNQSYSWKNQSKHFLQTLSDDFEICPVLFQYQKLRDDFYPQFIQSLYDYHKQELNQYNEWIDEWNRFVVEDFPK